MADKKKAVAAAAAVMDYIAAEEEAMGMQPSVPAGVLAPAARPGLGPVGLWGVSGRQSQMQMRRLMQMRTFR